MKRYLKSLNMRAKDGTVFVPPACCINCNELLCPISCEKYQKAMGVVKCTQVEMEFGCVDTWGELLRRVISYVILTVIAVALVMWICRREVQRNVVLLDQLRCRDTSSVRTMIAFEGSTVDQEQFSQALTNALQSCKEMK